MHSWKIGVVLGLTLLLSCASLDQLIQKPGVKMEAVKVADLSFEGITLDFLLLISNPNAFGLSLNGFDYDFILQGASFVSGNSRDPLQIGAQGNSTIRIPVSIQYQQIADLIQNSNVFGPKDLVSVEIISHHFDFKLIPGQPFEPASAQGGGKKRILLGSQTHDLLPYPVDIFNGII